MLFSPTDSRNTRGPAVEKIRVSSLASREERAQAYLSSPCSDVCYPVYVFGCIMKNRAIPNRGRNPEGGTARRILSTTLNRTNAPMHHSMLVSGVLLGPTGFHGGGGGGEGFCRSVTTRRRKTFFLVSLSSAHGWPTSSGPAIEWILARRAICTLRDLPLAKASTADPAMDPVSKTRTAVFLGQGARVATQGGPILLGASTWSRPCVGLRARKHRSPTGSCILGCAHLQYLLETGRWGTPSRDTSSWTS